ncbi:hypothetical protein [Amycolatopsis sp.]
MVVDGIEMELQVAFTAADGNITVVLEDVDKDRTATRLVRMAQGEPPRRA